MKDGPYVVKHSLQHSQRHNYQRCDDSAILVTNGFVIRYSDVIFEIMSACGGRTEKQQ